MPTYPSFGSMWGFSKTNKAAYQARLKFDAMAEIPFFCTRASSFSAIARTRSAGVTRLRELCFHSFRCGMISTLFSSTAILVSIR